VSWAAVLVGRAGRIQKCYELTGLLGRLTACMEGTREVSAFEISIAYKDDWYGATAAR